jgi:DNA-directed RNA polymerase subunit RPC12/RpoP
MDPLPDAPDRQRRARFNDLVQTVPEARSRFGARDPRFQARDDVVHQAHAAQHTRCDRCGTPFRREALHPESSTVAGSALVCPRCNREFGGTPHLAGDEDESTP